MARESLMARLGAWIEATVEAGRGPDPAPPTPAAEPGEGRVREIAGVLAMAERLHRALADGMAVLSNAAREAGRLEAPRRFVPPALKVHGPAVAAWLKQDTDGARQVVGWLRRYYEATPADFAVLREAIESRAVGAIDLQAFKGRFFYLAKLPVMLKPYPVAAALFAPSASAPADSPEVRRAPAPAPAPAGAATTGPLGRSVESAGLMTARRLLSRLDGRMRVLAVALGEDAGELAPAAQAAAAGLTRLFDEEPAVRTRAKVSYRLFCSTLDAVLVAPPEPPGLKGWNAALGALGVQYREVPLMAQLFAAGEPPW